MSAPLISASKPIPPHFLSHSSFAVTFEPTATLPTSLVCSSLNISCPVTVFARLNGHQFLLGLAAAYVVRCTICYVELFNIIISLSLSCWTARVSSFLMTSPIQTSSALAPHSLMYILVYLYSLPPPISACTLMSPQLSEILSPPRSLPFIYLEGISRRAFVRPPQTVFQFVLQTRRCCWCSQEAGGLRNAPGNGAVLPRATGVSGSPRGALRICCYTWCGSPRAKPVRLAWGAHKAVSYLCL